MTEARTAESSLESLRLRAGVGLSRFIVRVTTGRWEWRVAVTGLVLTALMHPPVLGVNAGGNWDYIRLQAKNPFHPPPALAGSHQAKLAFRLVPPLLVRAGLGFSGWMVIQAALGLVVFILIARIAERHLGSRALALGVVLAVAATYLGGQYLFDDHAYFDTLAIAGLVGALAFDTPALQALCLAVAVWTDERAAIATLAVFAYAAITGERRRAVVAVAVLASYAAGRVFLGARYGLSTPAGPDWIGQARQGLKVSIPALWLTLKGLWIFPIAGVVVLLIQRRVIAGAALAGSVAASAVAAVAVLDVTRSAAYLLPAVLCGLAAIGAESGAVKRNMTGAALAACVLVPTFFVIVPVWAWILPLPIQLLPG